MCVNIKAQKISTKFTEQLEMERHYFKLAIAVIIAAALFHITDGEKRWYHRRERTVATFNAALFSGVPEVEERTELLIEEIRSSSVHVFCLQEVWLVETQQAIYNGVRDLFPNIVSNIDLTVDINADTTLACDNGNLQALGTCAATNCSTESQSTLLGCLVQNCLSELIQMSEECLTCLFIDNLGFTECATQLRSKYLVTYGLMLLSRRPLKNSKVVPFLPDTNDTSGDFRGYIQATVNGIGDLICTHLTSPLSSTYIGPPFSMPFLFESYEHQQYQELLTLFTAIDDLEAPILLGDFNHGPVTSKATWYLPFNYGFVTARGFFSPYVLKHGRCTFCASNAIVAASGFTLDITIDHIYLTTSSAWRVKSTTRIFDNVETATGLPLSDHYGVSVTLIKDYFSENIQLLPLPPVQIELNNFCLAAN